MKTVERWWILKDGDSAVVVGFVDGAAFRSDPIVRIDTWARRLMAGPDGALEGFLLGEMEPAWTKWLEDIGLHAEDYARAINGGRINSAYPKQWEGSGIK